MNLFGGDRHFVASEEQDFIKLSFGKCKQCPHSLEYQAASNSCYQDQDLPPGINFSHADVEHMQD